LGLLLLLLLSVSGLLVLLLLLLPLLLLPHVPLWSVLLICFHGTTQRSRSASGDSGLENPMRRAVRSGELHLARPRPIVIGCLMRLYGLLCLLRTGRQLPLPHKAASLVMK